MEVTPRTRLLLRFRNITFLAAFAAVIGLLAVLSTRYSARFDWTADGRNTLSATSRKLLAEIQGPLAITAFAREQKLLRRHIADLVARYQQHKPDLTLTFVNPDTVPGRVRALGISAPGELLIEHQGRTEQLARLNEQALTNALVRVARRTPRRVVALVGHGERRLLGRANHDLGAWGRHLERRGFTLQELDLSEAAAVPSDASVLVLAGPRVDLLAAESARIEAFVVAGGNLLWLADPGPLHGLEPLARALGIGFVPGTIIDPGARRLGLKDAKMVLVSKYAAHPAIGRFDLLTLFPEAVGLRLEAPAGWQRDALLQTGARAWSETGEPAGERAFDAARDVPGPLAIGLALQRAGRQRVVVVGDGDFLSNAYLGNGGNLDLGLRIINWLAGDDALIAIPSRTAPDLSLQLSRAASLWIGLGTLLGLPLLLLATGLSTWWWRRRR